MCGFAGILAFGGRHADPDVIGAMTHVIQHRGPDDHGYFVDGCAGFGFRRLSILDLSPSGHQPMKSADGRYVLVFNGEIYNYIELRRELQELGYTFKSSGDTEVLLSAYVAWGKDCLRKLNGMWAFLIYDTLERRVFGSRDRFGVKPHNMYRTPERAVFASEIKSIIHSGYFPEATNWETASTFLIQGRLDINDQTLFNNIERIPAGSAFELDSDGSYRVWHYWSLNDLVEVDIKDPVSEFGALFEDAVRLRMRSDVPVGVTLSGGLDSTSIACAMARLRDAAGAATPLWAFSYMAPCTARNGLGLSDVETRGSALVPRRTGSLDDRSDRL
jgi:asparagine synthase (glutamine-hydrolysing)